MLKHELVEVIVRETGSDPEEVDQILHVAFDTISDAVAHGDRVRIKQFGTFIPKDSGPRNLYIPATGETVRTGSSRRIVLRPHQVLKDRINTVFAEMQEYLTG